MGSQRITETGLDDAGGVPPQNPDRAREADLITLPSGVAGTNCFNCMYVSVPYMGSESLGFCRHPDVRQPVNARNCCARWDHPRVVRSYHPGGVAGGLAPPPPPPEGGPEGEGGASLGFIV